MSVVGEKLQPTIFELGQALSQHIGADPRKIRSQLRKALRTIRQLTKDEHRPALADQLQRVGQPAGIVIPSFCL